ncbi:RidA family protein [Nocardia sp. NPDC058176]|uniref:RidA family protein n=1 Tax=Nocardia sp. NPDC058176 TaxID=3346368 RepID=UPI0036D9CE9B
MLNPAGLPAIDTYRQVAVATGSRSVHVAGQVAWDAEGNMVGAGDLAAQVERCYRNVGIALAAAGASFGDVVKLTAYVVDWRPDKMAEFLDGVSRAAVALGMTPVAPATLIGVAALASADHLVEIEAVAVLD